MQGCGNLSNWGNIRNSEGQSSYMTAEEQASSQEPEMKNAPELLENHKTQPQQIMDELACYGKKESQESFLCPDQDAQALPLPDHSSNQTAVAASQPLEVLKRQFPMARSRLSFKKKIQQSLSQISKLGSKSSNITSTFASIPNVDSNGVQLHIKGRNRSSLATRNSCDASESCIAHNHSSQPSRPHPGRRTE